MTRGGQPVTGARVCMRADMGGSGRMSGMGVNSLAQEVSPGRYQLSVRMQMGGRWQGVSIVTEPGHDPVRVALVYSAS